MNIMKSLILNKGHLKKELKIEESSLGLLVNQFSSDKSLTGLAGQKIMIEELANEVKNLNKSLEKIKDQKKEIIGLETRLAEYSSLENEIVHLLSSLEFQKKQKLKCISQQ